MLLHSSISFFSPFTYVLVSQLYETELRKWSSQQIRADVCRNYDDDTPEPGVGTSFEPTVRWLNLYIKERNLPAVLATLLRVRARFLERLNMRELGPIRVVSDTQKCHPWFPSVLHSLISDSLLNTALPVNPSALEMQFCKAVVVAAHLVEQAKTSGWSDDDSDFMMRELLGCSRQVSLFVSETQQHSFLCINTVAFFSIHSPGQ
jgi:hypothetical protein